jgi:hypothetical protein
MKSAPTSIRILLATGLLSFFAASCPASVLVYDNLSTAATAGYSQLNSASPVFGDSLNLSQGGVLFSIGLNLFNSSSGGNTGAILAGDMAVNFYDNTIAYTGGALSLPLLGTTTVHWDLTGSGGLSAGFYTSQTFDISSLNITLPQNILVTQQFTQTAGTSLRNGVVLYSDAVIGSSPNTVYIKSATTPEGLTTFAGNPNQFGYAITVTAIPEPTPFAAAALLLGFGAWRMRVRWHRPQCG